MSWILLLLACLFLVWTAVLTPVLLARALAGDRAVRVRLRPFPSPRLEIEVSARQNG